MSTRPIPAASSLRTPSSQSTSKSLSLHRPDERLAAAQVLAASEAGQLSFPSRTAHRCFIGKPRKPCCGQGMKAALVVLTGRYSQQQIACLPVVPIGKQA
jgi:hypothetical protein